MILPHAAEAFILLCCAWAALSWVVPTYLLKPPKDDPDGAPRLTMPHIARPHLRSGAGREASGRSRRPRTRTFRRR
jgi:hypothetical protein